MATIAESRLHALLAAYLPKYDDLPDVDARTTVRPLGELLVHLNAYLDLLLHWNSRTNLTAVRDPEEIVTRHFGESLFAGAVLAGKVADGASVLDYGSGAGFPGLPIQLLLPKVHVTVAESQGKKVAFLREAVRVLKLPAEVWGSRVETMFAENVFDAVTMRAVDGMARARAGAWERVRAGGWRVELVGAEPLTKGTEELVKMPGLRSGWIELKQRL